MISPLTFYSMLKKEKSKEEEYFGIHCMTFASGSGTLFGDILDSNEGSDIKDFESSTF